MPIHKTTIAQIKIQPAHRHSTDRILLTKTMTGFVTTAEPTCSEQADFTLIKTMTAYVIITVKENLATATEKVTAKATVTATEKERAEKKVMGMETVTVKAEEDKN